MPTKKSVKKSSPKKATTKKATTKSKPAVKKSATRSPKKAGPKQPKKAAPEPVRTGSGRPKGHKNYVPSKELEVRDSGNFRQVFNGEFGPKWIRVYASTQEASLALAKLMELINAEDKKLFSMICPPKPKRSSKKA